MRPQSFRHQMPHGRPYNQFQGPRNHFGPRPPRFAQPGMMPPPPINGPMPVPGMGQKGSMPKLESLMDTANRFLATAQSFSPIVQQATPMIRNLPALWKLYKGFQSLPKNTGSKDRPEHEHSAEENKKGPRKDRYEQSDRGERFERDQKSRNRNHYKHHELSESPTVTEALEPRRNPRPSMPKIFQPDYHFDE